MGVGWGWVGYDFQKFYSVNKKPMADMNLGSAVHKPVTETTDDIQPNRLILTISQNILITILGFCVIKSISIGVLSYLKHLLHVCQ